MVLQLHTHNLPRWQLSLFLPPWERWNDAKANVGLIERWTHRTNWRLTSPARILRLLTAWLRTLNERIRPGLIDSSRMKGKVRSGWAFLAEQERRDLSYAILEVHQVAKQRMPSFRNHWTKTLYEFRSFSLISFKGSEGARSYYSARSFPIRV